MLGLAVAVFHWTPDVFWRSTPNELYAAIDFQQELNVPPDDRSSWQAWHEQEFGKE